MAGLITTLRTLLRRREDNDVNEASPDADTDPRRPEDVPRIPESEVLAVFPREKNWGYNVKWRNYEKREVQGWMGRGPHERRLQEGDLIGFEMETGRVGVFEVLDVEYESDPPDYFTADVMDRGYLEEK